ncbi:UDP binding domain-containing protein, partial [Peribacillus sp. NPDC058002]
ILGDTIRFASSVREATAGADAVFIVTEWNEFRHLDVETLMNRMKQPIVFDGRNCLEENRIRACKKIEYYPVGRPAIVIDMT